STARSFAAIPPSSELAGSTTCARPSSARVYCAPRRSVWITTSWPRASNSRASASAGNRWPPVPPAARAIVARGTAGDGMAARGAPRDGPSALGPGGEEGQLAPARQLLGPPLRARSAGAIRIRAAGQQPQRTAPAGVARTRAVGMRLQARGQVVADAGVPGAVAAFEQVEPPAAVGGGVHGRDGRSANAVGGWYRRCVRRRGTWKGGHRPPRNGGGPPG